MGYSSTFAVVRPDTGILTYTQSIPGVKIVEIENVTNYNQIKIYRYNRIYI